MTSRSGLKSSSFGSASANDGWNFVPDDIRQWIGASGKKDDLKPVDIGAQALADPAKFGGKWRLPSVTRDDPAYHDNVYWRGRIWPPLNYLTYQGLKRAGFDSVAADLADDSAAVFAASWGRRQCPENFSAETGLGDDQPDTDLFYGWGVLMPIIAVNEIIDVTPWHGWELNNQIGRAHV